MHKRNKGLLFGVLSLLMAQSALAVEWKLDSLEQFIAQPQGFVAGTYMPYAGMASADDRRAVGCFLGAQK